MMTEIQKVHGLGAPAHAILEGGGRTGKEWL